MNRPNKPSFTSSLFDLSPGSILQQSLYALASAVLLLFSFPGFDLNYLAWVALSPLMFVLAQGVSLRRALWLGWLTGVIFTFFAENWIAHSMVYFGGMAAAIAYAVAFFFAAVLAIFPAIFALVMSLFVRRFGWMGIVFAPFVWVTTEWLRPMFTGVTWNALGISQVDHFLVARLAQYGGVYLVGAEVLALNTLLILMLKSKERGVMRAAAVLMLLVTISFIPTAINTTPENLNFGQATVVGVQPNLPPDSLQTPEVFERDLQNNIQLTKNAIARAPDKAADLVVWAESPLALFYETDSALRERLNKLASETSSYFILNTVTRDDWRYHNSIHTISPQPNSGEQPLKRYDKIRLVPFGEYVPFKSALGKVVEAFATSGVGGFTPGTEPVVNILRFTTSRAAIITGDDEIPAGAIERTTNFARVGTFICYEAAYPNLVRGFVRNGATLLVNVSNDAWFGNTSGPRQHLAHARMRAIENDRDLVRVTNSGISALITAEGRVVDPLPSFQPGAQIWRAQLRRGQTFYTRHGDWFAVGCAVFTLLVIAASMFFRQKPPLNVTSAK
ncbi:MAG: apolipoprotein N-acyltransferase [Blastocatellales bacterium]